jgi:putative transposase
MSSYDPKRADDVALFRYGLIGDLIHMKPGEKGIGQKLKEKSDREYDIPGTLRRRVADETLRDWLKAYRRGGFEALRPKPRGDAGLSRALPRDVQDILVSIKDAKPELSVQLVIQEARKATQHGSSDPAIPPELDLSPTTVHRLLTRAGLMHKAGEPPGEKDRRRFAFEKAGELWMSDVMHGPAVTVAGKVRRKSYLIALIDDATRVVPYAAFALSENTSAFLPVFKQAVLRRGVPKRLFVDNGAAYRSHWLSLVCARVGTTLIHARPYQPESKGKQERWFRTVRMQLLPTLVPGDFSSLDALNRKLWTWVETEYHRSPHRGLEGDTPLDRWAKAADEVRYLDGDLGDLFLSEAKRKVHKDRTVCLNGMVYEVDAQLVGTTVTLRFDPGLKGRTVQVFSGGKKVQDAKVVDLYANCFVRRERPSQDLAPSDPPPSPPSGLKLSDLARRSNEEGR